MEGADQLLFAKSYSKKEDLSNYSSVQQLTISKTQRLDVGWLDTTKMLLAWRELVSFACITSINSYFTHTLSVSSAFCLRKPVIFPAVSV